jgi:hypothetical protein
MWQGRKLREFSIDGLNFLSEVGGKVISGVVWGRWWHRGWFKKREFLVYVTAKSSGD